MFKLHETRFIIPSSTKDPHVTRGLFDLAEYTTFYEGDYVHLIWNPLYKQCMYVINEAYDSILLAGGVELVNDDHNAMKVFRYNCSSDHIYFFSGITDDSVEDANVCYNIVDLDYSFLPEWNKAKLWISTGNKLRFPYHEINITTDVSKAYFKIEVHH